MGMSWIRLQRYRYSGAPIALSYRKNGGIILTANENFALAA